MILGGPRYNGVVLPGDGFPSEASDLAVYNDPAVQRAVPRRAARFHEDAQERLRAARRRLLRVEHKTVVRASAGVFHNRVTLNDSMLLGGNPPFQPQVASTTARSTIPAAPAARRRCRWA